MIATCSSDLLFMGEFSAAETTRFGLQMPLAQKAIAVGGALRLGSGPLDPCCLVALRLVVTKDLCHVHCL